jgi:hypothetical protein
MENWATILLLMLATAILGQANYLDQLKVLQIDANLINQANDAINDLKNTLYQRFQCKSNRQGLFGNLRGYRLL